MTTQQKPQHHRGLHCSSERHLWELGALPLAIYMKGDSLTKGGKTVLYCRKDTMQDFLGASRSKTYQSFLTLEKHGWIKPRVPEEEMVDKTVWHARANTHRPTEYIWVQHDQDALAPSWVSTHPGCCYEREARVWDGEPVDEVLKALSAASSGRYWHHSMVRTLLEIGYPIDQIPTEWENYKNVYLRAPGRKGIPSSMAFKWQFISVLKKRHLAKITSVAPPTGDNP